MKKVFSFIVITAIITTMFTSISFADNPVVQTIYTADPAPMVYKDTVYLYTGHDEDNARNYTMNDWRCYSSKDMVNWTDHGAVLSYKTFAWAKGDAWAGQCVERDGKFYYYVPLTDKRLNKQVIGVAVADSPTGPFKDAIGKPLITTPWGNIDPTVFVDDDGQAYMYWGNPDLYYVKLNKDMVSFDTSVGIVKVPLTEEGFGKRNGNKDRATLYEEGPWFYKRSGIYYMVYAASGIPENICYATSSRPTGPWSFKGIIMPSQGKSFTNHPGVADFKGNSYFFYHNGDLPRGGGFTRSVCIEKFSYNADGTFPTLNMTKNGVDNISNLNPYVKNEAETIAWEYGVETQSCSQGGMNVYDIDDGDYIKVKSVDFGAKGAEKFSANVSCSTEGGTIEMHLDSLGGKLIGTLPVTNTGGDDNWKTVTTDVSDATGVHDVFFVFKSELAGDLFKFDNWKFDEKVNHVKGIKLNTKTVSLVAGKSKKLSVKITPSNATNKKVNWKSSNSKVAKVDNNGKVTAVAAGLATIKVTTEEGNFTASCKINVIKKK